MGLSSEEDGTGRGWEQWGRMECEVPPGIGCRAGRECKRESPGQRENTVSTTRCGRPPLDRAPGGLKAGLGRVCAAMFVAAAFTTAKSWKQLVSTDG